jgi:hypothetical protein
LLAHKLKIETAAPLAMRRSKTRALLPTLVLIFIFGGVTDLPLKKKN